MNDIPVPNLAATTMLLLSGKGLRYGAISTRADRGLALIDRERVSSVPGILGIYERDKGPIRADVKLSAIGQQERIQEIATSRLASIATVAKAVVELEQEYLAEERQQMALPEWSQQDPVEVDLALVALVASQKARASTDSDARNFMVDLVLGKSTRRVRLAVARLPFELSGITEEEHTRIRHSLISAAHAARLDGESQIIGAARRITQSAIDYLTTEAQPSHSELVNLFGNSWKLAGTTSPEERMARIRSDLMAEATPPEATL